MNDEPNHDFEGAEEPSCSGAERGGPWDEWDEPVPGPPDDCVWDAFEPADTWEDPEPEHGDFWLEPDDEEEVDR